MKIVDKLQEWTPFFCPPAVAVARQDEMERSNSVPIPEGGPHWVIRERSSNSL
ncbi:MAG: hypothetical protein JWM54_234 [Acidobacteriaceae bacterium]|jgi:hypothetical protein|nr:hypothetical protein [Acidobacteriaceae bacterium]